MAFLMIFQCGTLCQRHNVELIKVFEKFGKICFFLCESYFWPLISGIFMIIFFRIRLYELQPTRIILIRVRMIFILLQKSVGIYVIFFTLHTLPASPLT